MAPLPVGRRTAGLELKWLLFRWVDEQLGCLLAVGVLISGGRPVALGSFDLTSGDFSSGQTLVTYVSGVRFEGWLSSSSFFLFIFQNFYPSLPPYFQNFRSSSFGDEQKFPEWFHIMSTSLTLFEVDVTGLPVNIEVTRLQSLSRRSCDWGTVLKTVF